MSEDDKRNITANAFAGVDEWLVPMIVKHMYEADDLFFDSVSQIHMPRWSKGRIVLAGDAAHATSFWSGQGSSMALVGAYILASELATRPDYISAFQAYETLARPFVERNQALVQVGTTFMGPKTQEELDARNEAIRKMATMAPDRERPEDESRLAHSALVLPRYT
jgi:2-polyprenyl-6-methoxyphenol hydroxylase-like FAD-dependent oxidoreductase